MDLHVNRPAALAPASRSGRGLGEIPDLGERGQVGATAPQGDRSGHAAQITAQGTTFSVEHGEEAESQGDM